VNNLDDAEIIAAARVGFLDEAADMLQQFEQALLVMESTPEDAENLNAAFRAAHTIKGTAGLFGCDAVVSFTHEVETLLEALRSGQLAVTEDISAALLEGRDQMQALIDEVRTGAAEASVSQRSVTLGEQLRRLHGAGRAPEPPAAAPAASAATASAAATAGLWHLSLRFGADALRNGLDPLAFLRYLGKLGTITARHTFTDQVPALAALDAEACYLGFELRLSSEASQSEIEAVFEFAADDCSVRVLPPEAGPKAYRQLLAERCGDDEDSLAALTTIWQAQGVDLTEPAEPPAVGRRGCPPPQPPATRAPAGTPERRASPRGGEEARFVKVRADKLDHLIDLIGELVIAGSGAQMVANQEGSSAFLEATQRVSRPGAGHARRRAGAAHGAGRRDLLALPARGARHLQAAGQGDRVRRHRWRHRARQVDGRDHRRPADAPGAQQPGPRHRGAGRAPGRRQARHRAAGPERLPRRRQRSSSRSATTAAACAASASWPRPSSAACSRPRPPSATPRSGS
jgi:two-component system chemotaxis sensor kinase CheA